MKKIIQIGKTNFLPSAGFLTHSASRILHRKIIEKYNNSGIMKFGKYSEDLRQSLYSFEHPYISKKKNKIAFCICSGFIVNNRKTWLLYANQKIVALSFSVKHLKNLVTNL